MSVSIPDGMQEQYRSQGALAPDDIDSFSLNQFPRLARLREQLLGAMPALCIERARFFTEYYRREGFDETQPMMRQARALAYTLDNLPAPVFDDELIAGSTTSHRHGVPLFPEFTGMAVWPELPTISRRDESPVFISDEDADTLANEIFPFWQDLNIHEYVRREGNNPFFLQVFERLVFFLSPKSNGISHLIPDYQSLVRRGLLNMIDEAEERERKSDTREAAEFFQAVGVSLKAVIRFASRYARACRIKATGADPGRAGELHEIACILERVPANPCTTFHEAVQAIWIMKVALHQENTNAALSFGRLDQIFYPYYREDRARGAIDEKRACELLGSLYIKLGDHTVLKPRAAQKVLGGASMNQAITIGGLTPDGADGVNDMTYLMLKTAEFMALREPNLGARWNAKAPPEYRRALIKSIYRTGAAPALYNDEEIVASLTSNGVCLEHARDYGIIGCVETNSAGRTMGMTGAILLNIASVLELSLFGGMHPGSKSRVGPETGLLTDFSSYEDFLEAFHMQIDHMVDLSVESNLKFAEAHAVLHPTPLLSALIQGTLESGKDVTRGGAMYNSSGVSITGLADVVDSLAALKRLVFGQRVVSLPELFEALKNDFVNHERTRALLVNKAPKYGTDDPAADDIAVALVERIGKSFARHTNPRGGRYHVGYWSMTMHAGNFSFVGSLPNGRKKNTPLASGATPVSGVARKGPTASLLSTAKLPSEHMANCIANNHKFSRNMFDQPGKLELFQTLVDSYFKAGGMQLQFNIHDKKTLEEARDNPDKHKDLLVRVSGYSAYFCDLNLEMQNEIIARTEDSI